ncbi:MAG: hypothetical protein F6K24_48915, partial [Okeania sp. SIO2D1]|nr:hypothetical protein [Okeania sp. SIO2D1]
LLQEQNKILSLESIPRRSEDEIVALLGGSFLQSFTEDATVGLANLAGSALLGNFQQAVGRALGLSEFRLFPTSAAEGQDSSGNIGIGAEIGIDITNDISFSTIKVLTDERPAQFGLRYRLDDNLLFRGLTDFQEDSQALFEYEIRF